MIMLEEWKDCVGYPGYLVSNLGRVRRIKPGPNVRIGRILKPFPDTHGYPMYSIWVNGKRYGKKAHKLVADTFLPPKPTSKHEVAHYDGSPANPCLNNLRWATHKENFADKKRHGTHTQGERHGASKLTNDQAREAKVRRVNGESYPVIAKSYGVNRETIRKLVIGESWGWLE